MVGGGQLVIQNNTERCDIVHLADTQARRRKYCWFVMRASTSEYYLLRFCAVQFQVIILSPGLNARQFEFTSGRAIFSINVVCLSVSNALEKSKANTRTNGCMVNMVKTVWRRIMRAASVEPVGRNAN